MLSFRTLLIAGLAVAATAPAFSQMRPVVPGSGRKVTRVGDDFEDPKWKFFHRAPKSSKNIDKQTRFPLSRSANGRWQESAYRGDPDQVERVETPKGGLPGSKGALLIRTLHSGIPRRIGGPPQQDDLLVNVSSRVGMVPVRRVPNFVVRVWVPPTKDWDPLSHSHFGVRAALRTTIEETKRGFLGFKTTKKKTEEYWPGFFFQMLARKNGKSRVLLLIRGNNRGNDLTAKEVKQFGWWTLGMSITQDGACHFYAKPGVKNLTAKDHLYSSFPYGYRAETFNTFFFNIVSRNDGRTWSTPFIIDDPTLYFGR